MILMHFKCLYIPYVYVPYVFTIVSSSFFNFLSLVLYFIVVSTRPHKHVVALTLIAFE